MKLATFITFALFISLIESVSLRILSSIASIASNSTRAHSVMCVIYQQRLTAHHVHTTTGETKHREENIFLSDETLDCTVAEVHGLPEPGHPDVPVQYQCATDDGDTLFIDGDAIAVLGDEFESGHTRMSVPSSAVSINGRINLNQAQGAITVSNDDDSHSRRKLTRIGTYSVLVIRVVSSTYDLDQTEADMYNDVFADENNLVSANLCY